MSNTSVQLAAFASTFRSRAQKLTLVQENSDENFKNIYSRSNKLVKLSSESIFRMIFSYIYNNVPTGAFIFVYSHGTQAILTENCATRKCHSVGTVTQSPPNQSKFTPEAPFHILLNEDI